MNHCPTGTHIQVQIVNLRGCSIFQPHCYWHCHIFIKTPSGTDMILLLRVDIMAIDNLGPLYQCKVQGQLGFLQCAAVTNGK
jgi:hypothetical protein